MASPGRGPALALVAATQIAAKPLVGARLAVAATATRSLAVAPSEQRIMKTSNSFDRCLIVRCFGPADDLFDAFGHAFGVAAKNKKQMNFFDDSGRLEESSAFWRVRCSGSLRLRGAAKLAGNGREVEVAVDVDEVEHHFRE